MAIFKDPDFKYIQPHVMLKRKYIGHKIIGLWPAVKTTEVINIAAQAGIRFVNDDCK